MLGIHALNASVALLLEIGISEIERIILSNTEHLNDLIRRSANLELLSSMEGDRLSGIVTFRRSDRDNEELFRDLRERGVYCAVRGGGIRFSPHFYTPRDEIERAIDIARSV
jgi:selenocysteine lyase/cysteine desulfurase